MDLTVAGKNWEARGLLRFTSDASLSVREPGVLGHVASDFRGGGLSRAVPTSAKSGERRGLVKRTAISP